MNEDAYLLVSAPELSREFNDLASYYSDFHKEVWGFRPRHIALCACDYSNEAELRDHLAVLKSLIVDVEAAAPAVFAQEEADRKKALDDFEAYVANCIQVGAGTRTNAIAWICESYNVENMPGQRGWEYLEYQVGIPYGYINNSLKAAA